MIWCTIPCAKAFSFMIDVCQLDNDVPDARTRDLIKQTDRDLIEGQGITSELSIKSTGR